MIHSFDYCKKKVGDVGRVAGITGTLAAVTGFKKGRIGEGVVFADGNKGMIQSFDSHQAQVMLFSRSLDTIGLAVARTGESLTVSVGTKLLGHTITSLGYLLDKDKEPSWDSESEVLEVVPLGIDRRVKIKQQLRTGLNLVDLILPLGEGQRELLIGNKKTGKTEFCLRSMLTQARAGKICVYCLIGKKHAEITRIEKFMQSNKIEDKCVLVASPAGSSPGEIFLAPFTALAVAEHFRDQGKSSFVVLDDLTLHAKYFREISLLSGKFPGRESYPGDVFYTHARLLERAGSFDINGRTVTITALPVAETLAGDLTGYIQTNLMSMTDGHLYFDEDLFLQGMRPAINIFLSVTRVGRQTQTKLMQQLSGVVLKILKQRQEAERYLRFGTEMTESILTLVDKGDKLKEFFSESSEGIEDNLYPLNLILVLLGLILTDRWDGHGGHEWIKRFRANPNFQKLIDRLVAQSADQKQLLKSLEADAEFN